MKKVFIMAYARKNLGDDLFIKMILDKYNNIDFYIKVNDYNNVEELDKCENLHVLIGNDTDEELYKMNEEEYDAYIYIGGSIFMEGGKVYNLSPKFLNFVERCKKKNIPFCYVSSNYGPYQTKEYFELSKRNFKTCTDICFRDKYSYNLFKDIETVRYAPDYAFGYEQEEQTKINNSVGISVIDLEIRNELKHLYKYYYKFIIENIKQYIKEGKKVYLYSFCEYEGDEKILDKIKTEIGNESNLIEVKYDGNVEEFLKMYSKMEYVICSRFHAMVLSCVFRQKIFVISYSKKIDNVIDDLELGLPIMHFTKLEKDIKIKEKDFITIDEEKIQKVIKESKRQDRVFYKKIYG